MRKSILQTKKGDLNLSINAIVVLILAITMLGLGLGFMRNMFSKTTDQFSDVGQQMQEQIIEECQSSGERLFFQKTNINIKKGDAKDIFYCIRNDVDQPPQASTFFIVGPPINNVVQPPQTSGLNVFCGTSLDGAPTTDLNMKTLSSKSVVGAENSVMKMVVSVKSTAVPTTHSCTLSVREDAVNGAEYAKKDFYITVE